MRKIKSVETYRFEVSLNETEHGYLILYNSELWRDGKISEEIEDYNTADYLFELKIAELEGQ